MASATPAVGLWLPVLSCPGHVLLNSVVSYALDITVWLSHKFLKLNMYKIEFIIVPWQFYSSIFAISLNVPTNHLLRKYWLSTYFLTQYLVPYQVHLFGLLKVFLKSLLFSSHCPWVQTTWIPDSLLPDLSTSGLAPKFTVTEPGNWATFVYLMHSKPALKPWGLQQRKGLFTGSQARRQE